ncbi:E3 ubiquitin-protein ligase RZFP34 isoform X4 [Zea mays]|uniref:CHY-type/CTCHY-type/RING-type Zinc finger protein n=1 Tax=Zea mays TaxID=4577 RepID=B4FQE4_MAIZE|nr:uncharacterized protein LOC100192089 isoform X4 [Zea mays]ACF84337.1 unknown [Zea mays]ONL93605.1 CHY-type/CTCHY-type/RING-type Zinc finger protein [Zea mays]|eukprot:XP_008676598.1 uncharacterized protein LOC100192089 isoform X3 [Zea mays]
MDGDAGPEQHGCVHYRRGCKIRAPCCGEVFGCRHCHNEAKDSLEVSVHDRHVLPRHDIKLVICSLCNKEQDVSSLTKQGQCSSATVGVTCHTPHEKKNPSRLSTGAARLCELRSMSRQILLREMQLLRRRCVEEPISLRWVRHMQDWWRREFLSLWQMWMLLHHYAEGFSPLRGRSYASQLPCLHGVSIRLDESYQRAPLRTHHPPGMPLRDESAPAVFMPGVPEVCLQHVRHLAKAGSAGCSVPDASDLSEEDGMDPLQRLWRDVQRAVPHLGAQVPWMQLLQHPADEGRSSRML